mgnify:CR=1 FL=1|jgi:hypothetical protein
MGIEGRREEKQKSGKGESRNKREETTEDREKDTKVQEEKRRVK